MTQPREFAVLFSSTPSDPTSVAGFDEDGMSTEKFDRFLTAAQFGTDVARQSGQKYMVMERTPDGWRSARGHTKAQVLERWS